MQAMNVAAPRPPLMVALVGTGAVSLAAIVAAALDGGPTKWWIIGGATLYLASVAITGAYNVPRNNALAASTPPTRRPGPVGPLPPRMDRREPHPFRGRRRRCCVVDGRLPAGVTDECP